MPTRRYRKTNTVNTNEEYYSSLVSKRKIKTLTHYATPRLKNPTISERASISTVFHIWSYGDRLYKLADQYYGDSRYWWVIAWWNGYGAEAQINLGTRLYIPTNIESALNILGV